MVICKIFSHLLLLDSRLDLEGGGVKGPCENNANVWCGTFVHCSPFAEAANRPCSLAVCLLLQTNLQHFSDVSTSPNVKKMNHVRLHLNVSYANFLWSTDSWWIAFSCLPNIRRTAKCCLLCFGNTSTSNIRIVFACRIRICVLFAFRCKLGFAERDVHSLATWSQLAYLAQLAQNDEHF